MFGSQNTSLTVLRLYYNQIGDAGASGIGAGLAYVSLYFWTNVHSHLTPSDFFLVDNGALSWCACVRFAAKTKRYNALISSTIRFMPRAQLRSSVHSWYIVLQMPLLASICAHHANFSAHLDRRSTQLALTVNSLVLIWLSLNFSYCFSSFIIRLQAAHVTVVTMLPHAQGNKLA